MESNSYTFAALPIVPRQAGSPRAAAPIVPAVLTCPHDVEMQTVIVKSRLDFLRQSRFRGKIVPLPHEYHVCNLVLN